MSIEEDIGRLKRRFDLFETELAAAAAIASREFGLLDPVRRWLGLARAALRGKLRRRWREDREIAAIARSKLFDAGIYLRRYPDVAALGADPIVHYVRCGAAEGRDPGPAFDTRFYLTAYPDVAVAGINPFAHYVRHGRAEGRRPNWRDAPASAARSADSLAGERFPWLTVDQRQKLGDLLWRYGLLSEGEDWPEGPATALRRIQAFYAAPSRDPEISIVVPVYNQLRHTLACLESLKTWPSARSFEVLVGDDGSTDGTAGCLGTLPGLTVVRGEINLGFLGNCNRTALRARGRLIVFLNNDTVVLPGWLDALAGTFDEVPEAGLVGARLVYPDGRLQEAGGIVWGDAGGWNFGRLGDPCHPAYSYLRDADYCSGAAIMLPTALWRELGGFDALYSPAYYEDTDLAFRVRAAGRRVLYQPEAGVIHCEGASHGLSEESGGKKHQAANRPKFLERWRDVLAGHGDSAAPAVNFAERSRVGRILLIDATTPTPDRDSGSADTFNLMRILRRQGYHVTFVPENLVECPGYTGRLRGIGIECLHLPYVEADLKRVCATLAPAFDAVIVCRQPLIEKLLEPIKEAAPHVPVIFNTIDLHFLREAREAALFGNSGLTARAEETRRSELGSIARADATTVVSRHERDLLAELVPPARVRQVPIIRTLPAGPFPGWRERHAVIFIGGFRHPPNQDAARLLIDEIWPRARALGLDADLHIVGPDAPAFLTGDPDNRIKVLGHVPDLAAAFGEARLSIAPIRYGAGLKGKVIDSLLHGVPVIASPAAVEGSGLESGRHLVVADGAERMAEELVSLYRSERRWSDLAEAGRQFCADNYSVEAAGRAVASLLAELGLPGRTGAGS